MCFIFIWFSVQVELQSLLSWEVWGATWLQEAIEKSAPYEFLHVIMMAAAVHAPRGKPIFDMAEDDVEKMFERGVTSDEAKQKMKTAIIKFGKRGWIKKLEKVWI